jgi:hypothetical protein
MKNYIITALITALTTALTCLSIFFGIYRESKNSTIEKLQKEKLELAKMKDSLILEIQKIPTYQNISETKTQIEKVKKGGVIEQKIESKPEQKIKNK